MTDIKRIFPIIAITAFFIGFLANPLLCATPRFNVVVIAWENTTDSHYAMVQAGKKYLNALATDSNFAITWVQNPDLFTDAYLSKYKVILQLNFKPTGWNATSQDAFQNFMEHGKGGWIGIHHPGVYSLASAGTQPLFTWFGPFLGNITYRGYIASRCRGTITVEDTTHPCMKGVPKNFMMSDEEWFSWDKSPRPAVHMLATVDEKTFMPDSDSFHTMPNDHPVAWSNENAKYTARNIYISTGHSALAFANPAFTTIIRNAIFWAAENGTAQVADSKLKNRGKYMKSVIAKRIVFTGKNMSIPMPPNAKGVSLYDVTGKLLYRCKSSSSGQAFVPACAAGTVWAHYSF